MSVLTCILSFVLLACGNALGGVQRTRLRKAKQAGPAKAPMSSSKKALSCYTGTTAEPGDTTDCSEGEDMCFIRYKSDLTGAVSRYCTSASTCPQSGGYSVQADGFITRCCAVAGCNGGMPTSYPAGLYWIAKADEYTTLTATGLKLAEFKNKGTQRFSVAPAGDPLKGEHTITPEGANPTPTSTKYVISKVGEGEFTIVQYPVPGGPAIGLTEDAKAAFTLRKTVDWEVAVTEKKCPDDAAELFPSAKDVAACKAGCLAYPNKCMQKFEWNEKKLECYFVKKPCGELAAGDATLVTYKSKCSGVVCGALNNCHLAGVCDMNTGVCTNPLMADGSGCDDGSPKTVNDVCNAGTCAGVNLCAGQTCAIDAMTAKCHSPGTCAYATGQCTPVPKPGGTTCNDDDPLTVDDFCNAGVCSGTNLCLDKVCGAPPSDCHMEGVCQHADGSCEFPLKPDGTTCDDKNEKTKDDTCMAGICTGVAKCANVDCATPSACHQKGECNEFTGKCMPKFQPNTHDCDDGSDLTVEDKCDGAGGCAGVNKCLLVTCQVADPNKCEGDYVCNQVDGSCGVVHLEDGTDCDDGDDETQQDKCTTVDGAVKCEGKDLCLNHQCQPLDSCHDVSCDKLSGMCLQSVKDGADCDDGDENTEGDKCSAVGICKGTAIVTEPPPIEEIEEAVPEPVVEQVEKAAENAVAPGEEIFEDAQATENKAKEELAVAEADLEEAEQEEDVVVEEEEMVQEEVEEAAEEIQELKQEEAQAEVAAAPAAAADPVPPEPAGDPVEIAEEVAEEEEEKAELMVELQDVAAEKGKAEAAVAAAEAKVEQVEEVVKVAETEEVEAAKEAPVAAAANEAAEAVAENVVVEQGANAASDAVDEEIAEVAPKIAEEKADAPETKEEVADVVEAATKEVVADKVEEVVANVAAEAVAEAQEKAPTTTAAPAPSPTTTELPPAPSPEVQLAEVAAAKAVLTEEVYEEAAADTEEKVEAEVAPKADEIIEKEAVKKVVDEVPAEAKPVAAEVVEAEVLPKVEEKAEETMEEEVEEPVLDVVEDQAEDKAAEAVDEKVEEKVAAQENVAEPPAALEEELAAELPVKAEKASKAVVAVAVEPLAEEEAAKEAERVAAEKAAAEAEAAALAALLQKQKEEAEAAKKAAEEAAAKKAAEEALAKKLADEKAKLEAEQAAAAAAEKQAQEAAAAAAASAAAEAAKEKELAKEQAVIAAVAEAQEVQQEEAAAEEAAVVAEKAVEQQEAAVEEVAEEVKKVEEEQKDTQAETEKAEAEAEAAEAVVQVAEEKKQEAVAAVPEVVQEAEPEAEAVVMQANEDTEEEAVEDAAPVAQEEAAAAAAEVVPAAAEVAAEEGVNEAIADELPAVADVVAEQEAGPVVLEEAKENEGAAEDAAVHAAEAVEKGEPLAEAVSGAVEEEAASLLAHRKKRKQIRHDHSVKKAKDRAEILKNLKAKTEAKKIAMKGAIETARKAAHSKYETKHAGQVKHTHKKHPRHVKGLHAKHTNHVAHGENKHSKKETTVAKKEETKAAKKDYSIKVSLKK